MQLVTAKRAGGNKFYKQMTNATKKFLKVKAITNLIQRKLDSVTSENKWRISAEIKVLQDKRDEFNREGWK